MNQKQDTKTPIKQVIKDNWFIIKIALKEAPFYAIHLLTAEILSQIVVFIEHVYMIGFVINCIQYQKPFWHAALFIISVFVFLVLIQAVGNLYVANYKPKGIEKINRRIKLELYEKAATIDLSCYDDPKFYTDFVWAMSDVSTRIEKVMQTASEFLGAIAGIFLIGGYILTADPVGIIFVIIAFAISMFCASKLNKLKFKLDILLKPLMRKRDYINRVFYLNDYSKELRVGEVKEKLNEDFEETNAEIQEVIAKETRKMPIYQFASHELADGFICTGIYTVYLLYKAIVTKTIGYGTMVTLFNAVGGLKSCMQDFARILPEFQQHSLYVEKIRAFLDYDIKIKNRENAKSIPQKNEDLELRNVSFSYQEGSTPILKNINLTIKKGENIALVGYNGAGKTTLVKLLMRLYDTTKGEILCNGENIKNYDVDAYRKMFGTVFQDYQLFAMSLRENVLLDNCKADDKKITQALDQSGFSDRLAELANGLDTTITREFDDAGTNFSGGEAQKIAISRVLYRDSHYIILDEPSSALDPIAEYNLNNTILNLAADKTVIFISHRLSTTKMADRIYMLQEGEIVESGNHDELMNLNGKYAQMFNLQAEKYR